MIRRLIGKAARTLQRLRSPDGPAILMYHRIADESFDPWGLCVHPARFEEQVEWLARHRTVLPLSEFWRQWSEGRLPRDAAAITFDDGYACIAQIAAPLLARAGLHATVFLPVELIREEKEFWWDELERIVLSTSGVRFRAGGKDVALGPRRAEDRAWKAYQPPKTQRQKAFRKLWAWLAPMPHAMRTAAIADLHEQARIAADRRESHRPMTGREIRSADRATIDFGSHGLTHADLVSVDDEDRAREIGASFGACASLAGTMPKAFAYPHGRFDADCERLVELAGYELACSTRQEFVSARSARFALPRLAVGNYGADGLARLLRG